MTSKLFGRAFLLLWFSETAFLIGSALMSFALGVWVYEQSRSVEKFSYVVLSSVIPALVFLPISAYMADRFDRRWIIASCDVGVGAMVVVLAWLSFNRLLVVDHLYFFGAVGAILGTLRRPAYLAAIAHIVPADSLTRVNGLVGFSSGFVQLGAPLVAGYLMASWGLEGVVSVELVTVTVGALAAFASLSSASHALRGSASNASEGVWKGIRTTFDNVSLYFRSQPLMCWLAIYILIQEALLVLASSMVTPLILATYSSDALGVVMTFGALGNVLASLLLVVAKINKHLMRWVLLSDLLLSIFVMAAGVVQSVDLWCVCAFGAFACGGVSEACAGALWMRKVPKDRLGSVFAVIGAGNMIVMCIVLLAGSALVARVFDPIMASDSHLWAPLHELMGTGKGRGVGLLFVLAGAFFAVAAGWALMHPRLMHVDEEVQDASDHEAQAHADVLPSMGPSAVNSQPTTG